MISRVKGTQDFLDLSLFNFVIDVTKKQLMVYHFTEIATPIIEPLELFKRSLGEYTDVVTKEMFIIQPHAGDEEERICLRPEATASTVRAFIENGVQITPWKVFSYGPMFRYERPQKGRYRQFQQVTIEILGAASTAHDVQLIVMLDRLFHEQFHFNNYAVLLNFLGCLADRRIYKDKLKNFLDGQSGLCQTCLIRKEKNIMRVFDCKNEACKVLYKNAPYIADNLCVSCAREWQQLQDQLTMLSVSFAYAPMLVRGLDYYNNTVFEFVSENLGAQNTFCGGGRYDSLAAQLGYAQPLPSLGVSIGIERVMLLLEHATQSVQLPQSPALHVVMPLAVEQHMLALLLADTLRADGLCVDVLLEHDSIKSMMRQANRMGAKYALLLGEDEQKMRTVTVKNMVTGEQKQIAQTEVAHYLKS